MIDMELPEWAERLETERASRAWSKPRMARELFKAAGQDPNKVQVRSLARQIRGYERADHFPRDWATAYATVFGMSENDLFGLTCGADNEDMKRRTLLGLMATAAASTVGRDVEPLRGAFENVIAAEPNDRDADTWERLAYDYAHESLIAPAAVLHPELAADFSELTSLITGARGTTRVRLVHVAAQFAVLLATAVARLGDGRSARRWLRTAVRAADQTGDHAIAALARGRSAVLAFYEDGSRLANLELADEAIAVGRGAPCYGVASGHAIRAQVLAQLGRHDEAATALDDLRALFDRLPDAVRDDRETEWGWSEQRLHHVASLVHTFAGDLPQATNAQGRALAVYPEWNWQGRAQIEMCRAGALIKSGDVDEGARHMVRTLEGLPAGRRPEALLHRAAVTSLNLTPPTQAGRPSVQAARELLASTAGDR